MRFHDEHNTHIDALAASACVELFAAYDLALEEVPCEPADGAIMLCGVIGFTGPGVRGTAILAATPSPVEVTCPTGSSPRDWTAELTNQLMGRIKSKLLARGAEVYLSTPVVLRGEHIAPVPRAATAPRAFAAPDGGRAFVWVEAETADDFSLRDEPDDLDLLAEGDALLF
jgi:hypothetical protein